MSVDITFIIRHLWMSFILRRPDEPRCSLDAPSFMSFEFFEDFGMYDVDRLAPSL